MAAATAYGGPLAVAPSVIGSLGIDPGTGGTDVDLPRWRRPSLLAARKSDPTRGIDAMAATHLAFAGRGCPGGPGTARRFATGSCASSTGRTS